MHKRNSGGIYAIVFENKEGIPVQTHVLHSRLHILSRGLQIYRKHLVIVRKAKIEVAVWVSDPGPARSESYNTVCMDLGTKAQCKQRGRR